jgi:hypothetical protein
LFKLDKDIGIIDATGVFAGIVITFMSWLKFLPRLLNKKNHSESTNNRVIPKD